MHGDWMCLLNEISDFNSGIRFCLCQSCVEWIFDDHSHQIWLSMSLQYRVETPTIRPNNTIMLDIYSEAHSPAEGGCWDPALLECLEGDWQPGQDPLHTGAGPHGGRPCEHCLHGGGGLPSDAVQLGAPCSDQWHRWQQHDQTQGWQRVPGEKRIITETAGWQCVSGRPCSL